MSENAIDQIDSLLLKAYQNLFYSVNYNYGNCPKDVQSSREIIMFLRLAREKEVNKQKRVFSNRRKKARK